MTRIIYVLLVILMIMPFATPVCADATGQEVEAQGLITPQLTYISLIHSKLSIASTGEAKCIGAAAPYNNLHTVELLVELQKQNGNDWVPIMSWTASGSGILGIEIERSHYVVRGTYRVCTTAKVRDAAGNLLENVSVYSVAVTY